MDENENFTELLVLELISLLILFLLTAIEESLREAIRAFILAFSFVAPFPVWMWLMEKLKVFKGSILTFNLWLVALIPTIAFSVMATQATLNLLLPLE